MTVGTDVTDNSQYIRVKVLGPSHGIVFRIKKNLSFTKLMKIYCRSTGLVLSDVRFYYDGQLINVEDTPTTLEIEDGDIIDCFRQQVGGP